MVVADCEDAVVSKELMVPKDPEDYSAGFKVSEDFKVVQVMVYKDYRVVVAHRVYKVQEDSKVQPVTVYKDYTAHKVSMVYKVQGDSKAVQVMVYKDYTAHKVFMVCKGLGVFKVTVVHRVRAGYNADSKDPEGFKAVQGMVFKVFVARPVYRGVTVPTVLRLLQMCQRFLQITVYQIPRLYHQVLTVM
jgi:hypothetical protein